MYNKISVKITMILIMTAALAVPSSVLQLSHAQGDLQNTIMNTHNQERAAVGVPPLTWSDTLAAHAQPWADKVYATGDASHSSGVLTSVIMVRTWHGEEVRHSQRRPGYSDVG